MTSPRRHTSRYWTAFASPEEAQQPSRAAYSAANRERGVLSAALTILADHLGGDAVTIGTLPHGILRAQLRDANGIRFSLTAWSTDEPLSQFFEALVTDEAREALCICLVPSRTVSVSKVAEHAFVFFPADIDAVASGEITLWELLDYKSVRRFLQGRTPIETEFALERALEATTTTIDAYFPDAQSVVPLQQDWIDHPLRDELDMELRRGRWTLLVGNSSSGKTILAMQAAIYLRLAGYNIRWLNVGTDGDAPNNVLSELAQNKKLRGAIFVIDDLQSSPGAARYVVNILRLLQRTAHDSAPTLLGISWPAFARDVLQHESDWRPLAVTADVIRETLLEKYQSALALPDVRETLELLGDDLLLIRLFLERTIVAGRAVSAEELASFLFQRRTTEQQRADGTALRATVTTGTLGQFDMAAREVFVRTVTELTPDHIEAFVKSGLLRRQAETITLGHRSLCGLLADWATTQDAWTLLSATAPRGANELVLAYLRSLESTRALDTLSALTARARFRERQKLNPRAAIIIEIWHAFLAVVERIERQQHTDPTWGGDPSSAMFAAQALARIGKADAAMRSIDFLRSRWRIIDDVLEIDLSAFSTHRDFTQIIERMHEEDGTLGRARYPAASIEKDRFHKTWLTGVILCAEAAATTPHADRARLIATVESELEPGGNFYPARVPWSSARVLLGLAGLGRNIHNSDAVQRCASWLTRDEQDDGARHPSGIWRPKTGTWNTDLETTALVLLALKAVDHNAATERLARQFLLSERPQWTAAGKELDGAVALHAYVETGGNFGDVAESARQLSLWARSEALWLSATDRSEFDQSCRVAQIASHLVNIGWTAIRTNLPVFLEALEPRTPFLRQAEPPAESTPVATPMPTPLLRSLDPVVTALGALTTIDLDEYTVVGGYRRHDERVRHRLRDRVEHIRSALATKGMVRENFLIWAAPGSGKSYLIQETARVLGDAITYIELNLAKMTHGQFVEALAKMTKDKPILCLIDEVDARETEKWPYEEAFPALDWNTTPDAQAVVAAIGSCPNGLHALERLILARWKGKDLLDRIPVERRFEIPATSVEDKVIIIASKLVEAAAERKQTIDHIEKLAVYYALTIPELQTPRQLRDLVMTAVERTSAAETRLRYDHLFQRGDNRNHRFWAEHIDVAEALAERFIRITSHPT